MRRRVLAWLTALASLLVLSAAPGRAAPVDPLGPDGLLRVPALARIVDQPGVLAPPDRDALDARLARFEAERGAQVAIVIVASTGAEPIEDFANRVGSTWKIGRHGIGDGLLLVVATQDRHARIEVARTLEGAIPDVIAKRVIQQKMGPHFKAGDYAGGLSAALDDLLPRIEQERLGGAASEPAPTVTPRGVGLHTLLPLLFVGAWLGSMLRRAIGAGGALVAGAGAGALATLLAPIALGAAIGLGVFLLAMLLGSAGRYGRAVGGPGGIYFPGSWGGGSGGGGGGGFSSGGGGDFSGGGASGNW